MSKRFILQHCRASARCQALALFRQMTDRFNIVAFWVNHKCAVIVGVIVRSQSRRTIVYPASRNGGFVKRIDLCTVLGPPSEMAARSHRRSAIGRRTVNEPHVRFFSIMF